MLELNQVIRGVDKKKCLVLFLFFREADEQWLEESQAFIQGTLVNPVELRTPVNGDAKMPGVHFRYRIDFLG
jgi:hypothetical protein